jgi:hypothetical protein
MNPAPETPMPQDKIEAALFRAALCAGREMGAGVLRMSCFVSWWPGRRMAAR